MRNIRANGVWAVPAALAFLFFLAPASGPAQTREGSPELAALVPRLAAWSPSEAFRSYFPDDLFEYINGAAESYLSYDFRELLVVDLEKKGTEATLTLEIYDMGGPVNAFGIFGAERYPENKSVAIGELGYLEGESLNFLSGRFYVKMLAFGLGEVTEAVLGDVGAKVAGAVKAGGGLPALVLAFPKDNLVARSEKYIKKNFMGYEFLHDGYVAAYEAGGREIEGFFIEGRSEKEAEGMLAKLLDALAADKQLPEKIALGVHVRNRYGQHLYVGRVRNVVCGAMRVPDGLEAAGEALLRSLTVSLAEKRSPK
ncbi:MAG: hypothetical protein A2V57_06675 [Candidatus Aminicenantes bacterium RBG_19FT_COMBO_65_30]|nr:MAG: hypothetical protein A2V57_06675 [Candidatus Aminicenantes bacterium RBG_19FT_COMBO_65_30]